jgi:calcineurin-like phosphoesterase family protein
MNEVVDPAKMDEKWNREICYLNLMGTYYPDLVPEFDIKILERKIYLKIDGMDFWNRANCSVENYDKVLPDWQEQMLEIIKAHKELGWHKYSMHPSSYFVVDGKLKSINYFFTYNNEEPTISIKEVESHIHSNRQNEMRKHLNSLGIEWDKPQPWATMDQLCWESFRNNYPADFIERVKECIK